MEQPQVEGRAGQYLQVRVRGLDSAGKAFFQDADLRPITQDRAILAGFQTEIADGEIIGLQVGTRKARVRISHRERLAGGGCPLFYIRLIAGQACPWADAATVELAGALTSPAFDQRRTRRVGVKIPVELRNFPSDPPISAITSDISTGGCYVEMLNPLGLAAEVLLTLWVRNEQIVVRGIVRTSDAGVGIGIEFLDLSPADSERLKQHLVTAAPVRAPL
ncbi:MAG: PilZ domain-containing protein [Acidobacteriales bacterium]|nr:PilZ domain-containing protein [Terriglobales bacterium]